MKKGIKWLQSWIIRSIKSIWGLQPSQLGPISKTFSSKKPLYVFLYINILYRWKLGKKEAGKSLITSGNTLCLALAEQFCSLEPWTDLTLSKEYPNTLVRQWWGHHQSHKKDRQLSMKPSINNNNCSKSINRRLSTNIMLY